MLVIFLFFIPLSLFANIEYLIPTVISTLPHDTTAFTQGLDIHDGFLYESTGLYGKSTLRKIDLQTGKVVKKISLSPNYFAEGIAILDDHLYQITWREKKAFKYDLKTLNLVQTFPYEGEGWGLCTDGQVLWMSCGTSQITLFNPTHFSRAGTFKTACKEPLNDLICAGNAIYANVWKKDIILRFDKNSGKLTGIIDAQGLLSPAERNKAGYEGVLNGIAYHPDSGTFFLTGKFWPTIFEVKFTISLHKSYIPLTKIIQNN